ncbi:MAG: PAS domain-containing sensor histidine kinase, partial [Promethearchaeota archaeon]
RQSERSEYKLKTKEGNFIYVETYGIPLKKNDRIYAVLGIGNDITEKKLAEQRLRESEQKYRYLFEDSPFAILLIDSKGEIIDSSPAIAELGGYQKGDLQGKRFMDLNLIHPDFLPILINLFNRFIKGEVLHRIDIQIYKKDGSLIWVNLQASLVRIGEETLVQVILHDITKRKEADLLKKEEIQKLKELDQLRKDLISRVSHELKTPLVTVFASSELLLSVYKDKLGEEILELIQMIQKGGKRLNHLVNNLLDITRIEYQKFKLEKESTNLTAVIKECSEEMRFLVKERNLKLILELPSNSYVELDRIRIEQVITNLLLNAIKNTPPEGIITIHLSGMEEWIEFSIADTGIGFTEEEMNIIFTRFGKIERYGEGLEFIDIQGSGLGLFISKEIVNLHGGTIRAESEGRGKGSTFIVKLPLS